VQQLDRNRVFIASFAITCA